jgi:hypothetical protein
MSKRKRDPGQVVIPSVYVSGCEIVGGCSVGGSTEGREGREGEGREMSLEERRVDLGKRLGPRSGRMEFVPSYYESVLHGP